MGHDKLQHAKMIVPVTDFQHAVATIANLADLRDQLRVNDLDVEIQVVGSLPIAGQNTLGEILTQLKSIKGDTEKIMATQADFDARLKALDDATNAIAADLTALKGQIAGGGLSADAETSILATLDSKIAALNALATPAEPPVA